MTIRRDCFLKLQEAKEFKFQKEEKRDEDKQD